VAITSEAIKISKLAEEGSTPVVVAV